MVLDAPLLNTQHYKVRIKGKVEQSWEGVAPSPKPWCSSYRKGSLRVTLDYGRQLYFFYLLILPPSWLVGIMPCPRKSQENSTKEKTATDKRQIRFFYTFLYLLGSTTHSVDEEVFPEYIEMVESPS